MNFINKLNNKAYRIKLTHQQGLQNLQMDTEEESSFLLLDLKSYFFLLKYYEPFNY